MRNVREASSPSMKLYADRIVGALGGRCQIEEVHPWSPPTSPRSRLPLAGKGLEYIARYAVYPLSLLGRRGDIFHVVDHAYSHLLLCVPPRRTVVTCHDLVLLKLANGEFGRFPTAPSGALRLFQFSVRFLRRAARIVAVSSSTADDLVKYLDIPRDAIQVIHSGVDPIFAPPANPSLRSAALARFDLGDRPVLLHVGNNWFYKNLEGVIRALALLQRGNGGRGPILVKAGKGLSPAQRSLAKALGVGNQIRELGTVSAEDLQAAYWAADMLVFPSLWEGFGWPPLEAMASGTPVVASNRGGLAEVVGDAARLVKPEEPEDIAGGIEDVLTDQRLRKSLISRGLERARVFSWQRAGEQLYQLYRAVLESSW